MKQYHMNEKSGDLLIVFVKNPVLGQVKTRLAKSIGNKKACDIYKYLLRCTYDVVHNLPFSKTIYYSDFINESDLWAERQFDKKKQSGSNIGERMKNAFKESFELNYRKVVIIGSDIINLNPEVLSRSFDVLNRSDLVIGPAYDGGYYLIGAKRNHSEIFKDIQWSTDKVLDQTKVRINNSNLNVEFITKLADLDCIEDLQYLSAEERKHCYKILDKDKVLNMYSSDFYDNKHIA